MPVELTQPIGENLLKVKVRGKLVRKDYEEFAPMVERMVQEHGKIRVLIEMEDFHGWTAGALWEDIKFDAKHFNHIERLAMVGDKKWQEWMAMFCRPFTTAKIRYFDHAEADEARAWTEAETLATAGAGH